MEYILLRDNMDIKELMEYCCVIWPPRNSIVFVIRYDQYNYFILRFIQI